MQTDFFSLVESNATLKILSRIFPAGNVDMVERDYLANLEEYRQRYEKELNNDAYTPLYKDMWRSDLSKMEAKIAKILSKEPTQFFHLYITPDGCVKAEETDKMPEKVCFGGSGWYDLQEVIILLNTNKDAPNTRVCVYR